MATDGAGGPTNHNHHHQQQHAHLLIHLAGRQWRVVRLEVLLAVLLLVFRRVRLRLDVEVVVERLRLAARVNAVRMVLGQQLRLLLWPVPLRVPVASRGAGPGLVQVGLVHVARAFLRRRLEVLHRLIHAQDLRGARPCAADRHTATRRTVSADVSQLRCRKAHAAAAGAEHDRYGDQARGRCRKEGANHGRRCRCVVCEMGRPALRSARYCPSREVLKATAGDDLRLRKSDADICECPLSILAPLHEDDTPSFVLADTCTCTYTCTPMTRVLQFIHVDKLVAWLVAR